MLSEFIEVEGGNLGIDFDHSPRIVAEGAEVLEDRAGEAFVPQVVEDIGHSLREAEGSLDTRPGVDAAGNHTPEVPVQEAEVHTFEWWLDEMEDLPEVVGRMEAVAEEEVAIEAEEGRLCRCCSAVVEDPVTVVVVVVVLEAVVAATVETVAVAVAVVAGAGVHLEGNHFQEVAGDSLAIVEDWHFVVENMFVWKPKEPWRWNSLERIAERRN